MTSPVEKLSLVSQSLLNHAIFAPLKRTIEKFTDIALGEIVRTSSLQGDANHLEAICDRLLAQNANKEEEDWLETRVTETFHYRHKEIVQELGDEHAVMGEEGSEEQEEEGEEDPSETRPEDVNEKDEEVLDDDVGDEEDDEREVREGEESDDEEEFSEEEGESDEEYVPALHDEIAQICQQISEKHAGVEERFAAAIREVLEDKEREQSAGSRGQKRRANSPPKHEAPLQRNPNKSGN